MRLLTVVFALCIAQSGLAQWSVVAPGRLVVGTQGISGGAMINQSGLLWASDAADLWMSPDDGTTWKSIPVPVVFPSVVYDIDFLDRENGIVTSYRDGLLITHDGGKHWKTSTIGNAYYLFAKFVGSPATIVSSSANGRVYLSVDSGTTWKDISPGGGYGNAMDIHVDKLTGTVYCACLKKIVRSQILWTTDLGTTWTATPATYNYDCYQFTLDPCDSKTIYIANEGTYSSEPDFKGRMLYSHDRGVTFNAVGVQLATYYAGSVICTNGGIVYAQSQRASDGVLRSTDKGLTWNSIGGPPGLVDSHLLCAKDDNTIFAVATDGSIWRTENSGGAPVKTTPNGTVTFATNTLFDGDTINECDSPIQRILRPHYSGCNPPDIAAVSIGGPSTSSYRLIGYGYDSIVIELESGNAGALAANAVVRLSDSSVVTIALDGRGIHAPFSCTTTIEQGTDTIALCDSAMRTIVLHVAGCSVPKITTELVTGADASDFTIRRHPSNPPHLNDSAVVVFKPTKAGSRSATYTLTFADGTVVTIPLSCIGDGELYKFRAVPAILADSITLCDSALTRTINVSLTGCSVPFVLSQGIVGPAAAEYSLDRRISYAPGNGDSAIIRFQPSVQGIRTAEYMIVLTDSTTITIPLEGFGRTVPFQVDAIPKVFTDTLVNCNSPIVHTISVLASGCPEATIVEQSIVGTDMGDYRIVHPLTEPLLGHDSAVILFKPSAIGAKHAAYRLTFSDGTVVNVLLEDVSKVTPFKCIALPSSAFGTDSLYFCDPSVQAVISLSVGGCPAAKIVSQRVIGSAAGEYTIVRAAKDSIEAVDSIMLTFHPTTSGLRDAGLEVVFDNGDTIRISLAGHGRAPNVLSILATNDSTNVIGGTLHVPVELLGLASAATAELVLHYDTRGNLEYNGSFDATNSSIDIPGEAWPGRSKLRLHGPVGASELPYSSFSVFADMAGSNYYRFDSLVVTDVVSACAFVVATSSAAATIVVAPQDCGEQLLSRFVHHRTTPQFRIVPNPASDKISIVSSIPVEADVEYVNALGNVVCRSRRMLGLQDSSPFELGSLPNGVLLVRIRTASGMAILPVMILR